MQFISQKQLEVLVLKQETLLSQTKNFWETLYEITLSEVLEEARFALSFPLEAQAAMIRSLYLNHSSILFFLNHRDQDHNLIQAQSLKEVHSVMKKIESKDHTILVMRMEQVGDGGQTFSLQSFHAHDLSKFKANILRQVSSQIDLVRSKLDNSPFVR